MIQVPLLAQRSLTEKRLVYFRFFNFGRVSYLDPFFTTLGSHCREDCKKELVLTLFLIGLGLSRKTLQEVGLRPLILGFSLWVIVDAVCLAAVKIGLIKLF